jgi:signal recognition particle GTPase
MGSKFHGHKLRLLNYGVKMAWKINQNNEHELEMQMVMSDLGVSTASKAIIKILMSYRYSEKEKAAYRAEASKLRKELKELKELIHQKEIINKRLNDLIKDH